MLNQQISDRRNAENTTKANRAQDNKKTNESKKSDAVAKTNAPEKDNAASTTTPATAAASDKAAAETKTAAPEKTQEATEIAKTESPTVTPVTAELLALMASSASQSNTKPIDAKLSDAEQVASATPIGKSSTVDLKALSEKKSGNDLPGKEAAAENGADFTATMANIAQTADGKQSLQQTAAKIQDPLAAVNTGLSTAGMQPVQPAAFDVALAATNQTSDKLTPHVGSPAWDQALGQKVVWMVAGTQQSASLTLNPPDLGPLQVVLHVSNGQAEASFTASQPEVRQALEAALPKLREMMSEAGIQLGQTTISTGMSNQQNKPGEQTPQNARHFDAEGNATDATARVSGTTKIISGQGLLDTFA